MVRGLPVVQETRVQSWVGKIPWRRECNPFKYSCLENPMDRGAWQAVARGVTKSRTQHVIRVIINLSFNIILNNCIKFYIQLNSYFYLTL